MFYGWWIVIAVILVQALGSGIGSYSYGVLVSPIGAEFGASRMELMWGMTGSSLFGMLVSPYLGAQVDRRPMQMVMALGCVVMMLGMVLIARTTSIWQFILAYTIFVSVAQNILGPLPSNALVSRWFTQYRGRALSLAALGTSVGGLLFPLLFQTLIDSHGWRMACTWIGIGATALVLPVVLKVVRSRPADMGLHPDGVDAAASHGAASAHQISRVLGAGEIFADRSFWQIATAMSVMFAAYSAMMANLVPYALGHGIPSKQAALLMSTIAITGFVGKLLFSLVADRVNLKYALLTSMLLVALPLLLLSQATLYPLMVLGAISAGLASGGLVPVWGALLARVYGPENFGKVMGMMQPVTIVTVLIGVPMTGFIFDRTGSYSLAFQLLAGLLVAGGGVVSFLQLQREPGGGR